MHDTGTQFAKDIGTQVTDLVDFYQIMSFKNDLKLRKFLLNNFSELYTNEQNFSNSIKKLFEFVESLDKSIEINFIQHEHN